MLPRIRTILELPVVHTAEPSVLSGRDRLEQEVRWVHVSEQSDMTGLLQGGEMVLGTGLGIGKTAAEISQYLAALEAAGAVALMVELLEGSEQRANDLRLAATANSLPVVILKRRVRFVEITETVHRLIVADQLGKLENARAVHETFTTLALESAGTDDIVMRAAQLIRAPVILEDLTHQVVAFHSEDRTARELLHDWEGRSRSTHLRDRTERGGPEDWLQTPVGTTPQRWGRLIVPVPTPDDGVTAMILERASQTLSINRLAERDQRERSLHAQLGLLDDLRRPHGLTQRDALVRAQALGLKSAPMYAPIVIRVSTRAGAPSGSLAALDEDRTVLHAVSSALKAMNGSGLVAGIQPGNLGVLLAVPVTVQENSLIESFCQALTRLPELSEIALTVGVGMSRPSLLDAATGFDDALSVARTAATLTGLNQSFFRSPDVRLRGLLAIMREDPRAQVFAEAELAGVLTPDSSDDLELLRRFLLSGGNKAALARTGYVSRPTLYARLARLEERLGVDLTDAESRTSLHVAVLLHDLRLVR